ncbi:MAG TPA: hypothetical protein VI685_27845 [Candidatus Angelobacter sp.]
MNSRRYLLTILSSFVALLAGLAYAGDASRTATVQGPPPIPFPAAGNDVIPSLGSFRIKVVSKFVNMMRSCQNYDATNNILFSPTLFDPATVVGRSDPSQAGHDIANTPFEVGAVNVGFAGIVVNKDRLLPPPTYPCFTDNPSTPALGDHGPCASGTGTRKVDTEIRSLRMSNLPGSSGAAITVRAGMHYNEDPFQPTPFADIMTSPGKVQSRSGPSNDPTRDFPATSFFNVYVKVDLPPGYCGANSPGITLYNQDPLKVVNKMLTQFPPRVVYLHDAASIVPILFLTDGPPGPNGPLWHRGEVLGYFLLAGHGVGFGSSPSDVNQFQGIMTGQSDAACPIQ